MSAARIRSARHRRAARRRAALILATAVLPAACQLEATIAIVPRGTTPGFVVTFDRGRKACVAGLTVTAPSDGTGQKLWAIRRADQSSDATCRDRFAYGVAPPGYDVVVPVRPLALGRSYEVSASGPGWSAVTPLVP